MKWLSIFTFSIIAMLLILPPACISVETYIWTDEDGNTVVSSEKPPDNITDFQTIGQNDAFQETAQGSSETVQETDTTPQYNDFPPLILEKIEKTARDRWPDNKESQEAMVARQVRACRYVMDTSDEYYPSVISRIAEDIGKKWPNDYERQEIYLRKQCQAYDAIRDYENYKLPSVVINSIKAKAVNRWPDDCVRQIQYIRKEVAHY